MGESSAPTPPPSGDNNNAAFAPLMFVCPSVRLSGRLSVACLDLTREQKDLGSPKSARWKPITPVTHEPAGSWVTGVMGFHLADFGLPRSFCSRVRSRHATDRRPDRRTDGQTNINGANAALLLSPEGGGVGAELSPIPYRRSQ